MYIMGILKYFGAENYAWKNGIIQNSLSILPVFLLWFLTKSISIPPTYMLLRLSNLLKIYGSSSHIRSAPDNARKYVGIHNCWTIASTSYGNCFQYAGVPFPEHINENAFSLTPNLSFFSLKSFLNVPAVSIYS